MTYLNYKKINNYDEYLKFCKSLFLKDIKLDAFSKNLIPAFNDADSWIDFFEAYELNDESKYDPDDNWHEIIKNFKGDLERKPEQEQYPVIIAYLFEDTWDRFGDGSIKIWDIVPETDIK